MNDTLPTLDPYRQFLPAQFKADKAAPAAKPDYAKIISSAEALLNDSALKSSHLSQAWKAVQWKKNEDQKVSSDAELARDESGRINLYPVLLQKAPKASQFALLREFGRLQFSKAPEDARRRWRYKLCLPSEHQIIAFQGRLCDKYSTYRELIESFHTAMDRLVALNLANALIANGIPFKQSWNLKVLEWGPTSEYAQRKKYHSVVPLASAYSPKEVFEDFGWAMADLVMDCQSIRESSVAEVVHGIIKDIIDTVR